MPPTDRRYNEIEAAKQHGGWYAWSLLAPMERDMLVAHEYHKSMRQRYDTIMYEKHGGKEKQAAVEAPWESIRRRFFNGGSKA